MQEEVPYIEEKNGIRLHLVNDETVSTSITLLKLEGDNCQAVREALIPFEADMTVKLVYKY